MLENLIQEQLRGAGRDVGRMAPQMAAGQVGSTPSRTPSAQGIEQLMAMMKSPQIEPVKPIQNPNMGRTVQPYNYSQQAVQSRTGATSRMPQMSSALRSAMMSRGQNAKV